jgi:hypothetical protein
VPKPRFPMGGRLRPEDEKRFLAYLDGLPDDVRPVYGIIGSKGSSSSFAFRPIAATTKLAALFYPDRVAFSQRSWGEGDRVVSLEDIAKIEVKGSLLLSKVRFRLADGSELTLSDVEKENARPVSAYDDIGVAAFDRSRLTGASTLSFYRACELGLELPEDLFAAR